MTTDQMNIGGAIKSLGNGKYGGYAVPFYQSGVKDLADEYFTAKTEFEIQGKAALPVIFHHGLDARLRSRTVSNVAVSDMKTDDVGLWAEFVLNRRDRYEEKIAELIEAGKLAFSSGSRGHEVDVAPGGEIKYWPIYELSLTPTPADWTGTTKVMPIKAFTYNSPFGETQKKEDDAMDVIKFTRQDIDRFFKGDLLDAGEYDTAIKAGGFDDATAKRLMEAAIPVIGEDAQQPQKGADAVKADLEKRFNIIVADKHKDAEKHAAYQAETERRLKALEMPSTPPPSTTQGLPGGNDSAMKAYEQAFFRYITTGEKGQMDAAHAAIKTTMNITTAGQGGYLVPTRLHNEIVKPLASLSVMRQAGVKALNKPNGQPFNVPALANTGRFVKTAESAAFDPAEPTLSQIAFNPYKYTRLSKVTDELLRDSDFDVYSQILAPDAAQALAAAENEDFTIGDGSGDPQGVVVGASATSATAANNAVTTDEIMDCYFGVSPLYRNGMVCMMNDSTIAYIRKLKYSGTGEYVWQPGLQSGQPDRLLGVPVYYNPSMAAIGSATKPIVFFNPAYFWICDFGQLEVKRLDELYAGTGEVGFRWFARYDSNVMLQAATKALLMKT